MDIRCRHGSAGAPVRWWQPPADAVRWFGVALAVAVLAAASMVLPQASSANSTATIGAVAYCVTTDGSPADAGLHAALYTLGSDELLAYATGTTDANGCGVFNYVPVDTLFFMVVWSADGQRVGNGDWFESGAMTIAPTVELDTPGFFGRLALH